MIIQHNASMEDYLERIAMLAQEHGVARVTQLSRALAVKKPSVTAALHKLSERGLVNHEKYGYVELTAEGKRIAQDVFRRHEALRKFLVEILGVDPDTARKDACNMEHFISPVTTNRLAKFVEFVLTCPQGRPEWLKGFNYYFEHGKRGEVYMARCRREDK
jgi:DtxR family Mn-dependent transcriptional regulator